MSRFSGFTWMILFCVAASALYLVKYRVMDVKDEVAALSQQLAQEKESIRLLDAEWSYLNRPERLEALSAAYLSLEMISPDRVSEWSDLPSEGAEMVTARKDP